MDALSVIRTCCYAIENQILFVTKELDKEDVRWRPESGSPSIGWIVGHILVNHDIIANHRLCENPLIISDNYIRYFSMGSKGNFPDEFAIEKVLERIKEINTKITEVLKTKNDNWLEEKWNYEGFPPNWQGKNRMKGFVLHFNHCFAHSGQILEIKRLRGKGAWGF